MGRGRDGGGCGCGSGEGSKDAYVICLIASACLGSLVLLECCVLVTLWDRNGWCVYNTHYNGNDPSYRDTRDRDCSARDMFLSSGALGIIVGIAQIICGLVALYMSCFSELIVMIVHIVFFVILLIMTILTGVGGERVYYSRGLSQMVVESAQLGITIIDLLFCLGFFIYLLIVKVLKKAG